MIYLKPVGGICNRIRSIDSAITLCENNGQDLTILWVNNSDLNCSFSNIFEDLNSNVSSIKFVDCPSNFPEFYLVNSSDYSKESLFDYVLRQIKNKVRGIKLDQELAFIKKDIRSAGKQNFITNKELLEISFSIEYSSSLPSMKEMEERFLSILQSKIQSFFGNKKGGGYIESCFRIHPIECNYQNFILRPHIQEQVDKVVENYNNNTVGLHIRRSDHEHSKKYSTTEKFRGVIMHELSINPETLFFLASDDLDTKIGLTLEFENKIICNDVKNFSRNIEGGIIDAVVDLYCLANTAKIYGSYGSTFSQTAALIGQIEEVTVL